MGDERTEAEIRAEGLRVSLSVKPNTAGTPVWRAVWRDAKRKSVMKTVGPAWLAPVPKDANAFVAKHDDRQRAKFTTEQWRRTWKVRGKGEKDKREKARLGALDDREAMKRAHELVIEHEQARDDLLDRIARSKDPRTFGAVADRWIEEKRAEVRDGLLKPSTMHDYEGMLRRPVEGDQGGREPRARIMRAFGDRKLREITGGEIDEFLQKLRDEHHLSERTRRKYAIVIGQILSYALSKKWIATNPTLDRERGKRSKRQRKAITVYTVEQVEEIAREAGGQDGEIIRLAAYSGLRQGELLALKWRNIDWSGQTIRVESSWDYRASTEGPPKSGHARTVPLADPAAEVLERVSRRDTQTGARDLVFPGERVDHVDASALGRRYRKACRTVAERDDDCPVLKFHDLRHVFGSLLAAGGIPLVSIQAYMGHQDIATTSVYLHFVPRSGEAAQITEALQRGSLATQVERAATM